MKRFTVFRSMLTIMVLGFGLLVTTQRENPMSDQATSEPSSIRTTKGASEKMCQKKFIVLSTQRSGSTWIADLLDKQDDIACGCAKGKTTECFWPYKELNRDIWPNVTWEDYKEVLDNNFEGVCQRKPSKSIGFRLQYNQVPPQFITSEEGNKLETYFEENQISVLHLVREASVLKVVSWYNARQQNGSKTTRAKALAKKLRETAPKMPWTNETILQILELERETENWQKMIHFMPYVPDHYIRYESMLSERQKHNALSQAVTFLTPVEKTTDQTGEEASSIKTTGHTLRWGKSFLQVHESKCSDRIEDYESFRKHSALQGSQSIAACDLIDKYLPEKS